MALRPEQLNTAFDHLSNTLGHDLMGTILVSNDGIVLSSRIANAMNPNRGAAVTAAIMGVTRRVCNELRIGGVEETIIKGDAGILLIVPVGTQMLVLLSLHPQANLGLVRLELRDAVPMIQQAAQA